MYNVLEKLKAMAAVSRSTSSPGLSRGPTLLNDELGMDVRGQNASGHDENTVAPGRSTPTSNSSPQGGGGPVALTADEERIKEQGLILILKELHDTIDRLTAEAYGWPVDLSDDEILERLVALNAERAKEEAAGHVRWLRPDYQIPRFAKGAAAKTGELELGANVVAIDKSLPAFPTDRDEHSLAVEAMLFRPVARWMRPNWRAVSNAVANGSSSMWRVP